LPLFGRYGYIKMIKCLTIINSFILQVIYRVSVLSFMVISKEGGGSRPIYGGLCTVGGYGEGYSFPTWVTAYPTDPSFSLGVITISHNDM
jgi:hypothetical protein